MDDTKILEGIVQVNELTVQLGNYYMAHAIPQNEILVKVATLLGAYSLSLDYLVRSPTFGEAEIKKLIEILQPHDPNEVAVLQQVLLHIEHVFLPEDRQELRQEYASRLMKALNMNVDLARSLLLSREMKERGMSDAEIDRAIKSAMPQNLF